MSIETFEDREEYLREMLDPNRSKEFFEELRRRESDSKMISYKKPHIQAIGGARPKSNIEQKIMMPQTVKKCLISYYFNQVHDYANFIISSKIFIVFQNFTV